MASVFPGSQSPKNTRQIDPPEGRDPRRLDLDHYPVEVLEAVLRILNGQPVDGRRAKPNDTTARSRPPRDEMSEPADKNGRNKPGINPE